MPKIHCTLCEHEWEEPVDSIWNCPNCGMGAPPTQVIEYSPAEFEDALTRIHSKQLAKPAIDRARVLYSTYGAPRPTDYDLLSILFDTIHIPEGWGEQLDKEGRDRLLSYIEMKIVRPISLDSFVELSPDLERKMKGLGILLL